MSYKDSMTLTNIEREKHELINNAKEEILDEDGKMKSVQQTETVAPKPRRRGRRWDDADSGNGNKQTTTEAKGILAVVSDTESIASKSNKSRWNEDIGATTT
jgi:hypothetical protein